MAYRTFARCINSEKTVRLWDVASGKELASLGGHATTVRAVAFSPDGKTLATGGGDGTVKLWNVASREELASLTIKDDTTPVWKIVFSPDGKTLATTSGLSAATSLLDVASRKWGDKRLSGYVKAFTADGKKLATRHGWHYRNRRRSSYTLATISSAAIRAGGESIATRRWEGTRGSRNLVYYNLADEVATLHHW